MGDAAMILTCAVPIPTRSEKNVRDRWVVRARRVKMQREAVTWHLRAAAAKQKVRFAAGAFLTVSLTRVAPVFIRDVDNLLMSMSATRDAVSRWLGRDDAECATLAWRYNQRKGKPYAVEVRIECTG